MVEISNIKVYDLEESVIACRNAMRLEPSIGDDFDKSLERAIKLAECPSNSGHCNFLTGIRVSFDIKYPNYISPELQRYHFFDIVTSSSKMHTLTKMADDSTKYNKYVSPVILDYIRVLMHDYNNAQTEEEKYKAFMRLVSNCPQGIELFMRASTNYMQLRTMYAQRKHHKLKEDWGAICQMIENLPYAKEFLLCKQ